MYIYIYIYIHIHIHIHMHTSLRIPLIVCDRLRSLGVGPPVTAATCVSWPLRPNSAEFRAYRA